MKFIKGMLIGGMVSAGMVMLYSEGMGKTRKHAMKKGKQFIKKMGII